MTKLNDVTIIDGLVVSKFSRALFEDMLQGGITAAGALTGGSLDINGPADISGNLTGVDTLTCTDLTIGSDATTAIGKAYLKTPNVSAVSYQRINANETLSLLNAAQMLSAIGGQAAGNYLTSYSETDTLDTVADRGSSTNQTLTSTNGLGFKVDSSADARIEIEGGGSDWSYIRLKDASTTVWDIGAYNGGNLQWRPAGGGTNAMTYSSGGVLTVPTLSVTDYGLASADIPNNAADTSGSSGSTTGNAATATVLATGAVGGVKVFELTHGVGGVTGTTNNTTDSLTWTITHGMGNGRFYKVEVVLDSGNYDTVYVDVTRPLDTTVKIDFGAAVANGAYRAMLTRMA